VNYAEALLESARFLIVVGSSYAKSAAIVSVANIGAVVAVRALLPTFHVSLLTRGGGFVIAGSLGGLVSVLEAVAVVELSGAIKEAAGLAQVFLPFVLAPSAVAALVWLFATPSTNLSKRSALALLGAIAGAALTSPLTPFLFEMAKPRSDSSLYVPWMILGLPLAAGATLGCILVRGAKR
jgi:hypothetical protein